MYLEIWSSNRKPSKKNPEIVLRHPIRWVFLFYKYVLPMQTIKLSRFSQNFKNSYKRKRGKKGEPTREEEDEKQMKKERKQMETRRKEESSNQGGNS